MRISYNWLKSYIDLKMPPEKVAEALTMAGFPVEAFTRLGGDHILEIEITSNRSDCLSYIGIAREIAALTGRKLKTLLITTKLTTHNSQPTTVRIRVEERKLCPRYTARIIKNVTVKESPAWLKARIEAMGLKPVNNIVDITNLCLFETGEPMHAFDLDKIIGGEVIIRRAKPGEKMTLIEGTEKALDDSTLVIADAERPIAIAGVMGGLNTEVTPTTKNVLLEAAYFDPLSIRRTSRKMGLATESSYRFERKVALSNIQYSSNRASSLISEMAGGEIGKFVDIGAKSQAKRVVELRYSRCNKILGLTITPANIKKILHALGLNTRSSSKEGLKVEVPDFRHDLNKEIDLIEEVSRIYGYDKIPSTIPTIVEQPTRKSFEMVVDEKICKTLTGLGLNEIITYSLLSKRLLTMSGAASNNVVEIANPLSSEQEVMRPSLITGLLGAMSWNINRKTEDLKLFELGNVYLKRSDGMFTENKHLSMGITGQISSGWDGRSRTAWFSDLMGPFEVLLSEFGMDSFSFSLTETKDERFSSAACASIKIENEMIGIAGELSTKILNNFDMKCKVYALEIDIGALLRCVSSEKAFKELPKYPSVFRDISIIVGKDVLNSQLTSVIKNAGGAILKETRLIDRYTGKQIPDDKISLTYRLEYQDLRKTLEEKEISSVHAKILRDLEEKLSAKLR